MKARVRVTLSRRARAGVGYVACVMALGAPSIEPQVRSMAPSGNAVGLATFAFVDTAHADTIRAALWYSADGTERDTVVALQALHVAPDAPYLASESRRPLVLISHGTGASQFSHWDTAEALARAGFIVASIRHAGDNSRDHSALGTDRYLYGRPTQMRALLDRLLADPVWGARIDAQRVGFFGYSAGGFTGLELLGARPVLARLTEYCRDRPHDVLYCADGSRGRFEMTGRYSPPERDPRIRAAVLWAPAFSFLFDRASLRNVDVPLLIVRALRDSVVVEPENVTHLKGALPRAPTIREVPGAIHYTLLAPCGPALARVAPEICADPPGVSRAAVHAELDRELVPFFSRVLGAAPHSSTRLD